MSGREPHHSVSFAARYASSTGAYLNARTALARLEELIEDAKKLKDNLDKVEPPDDRRHPWVGVEIASYYAVGFVTCLEWHARSRLVDLLTFQPSAARSDDLRIVRDRVVLDMLSANVTIASIVGASANISSLDDYLGVFSRVLSLYNAEIDGYKAIKAERPGTGRPWIDEEEIEGLRNLYSFRNDLVHEIGIQRVGHVHVRDRWNPDEAIRMGDLVHRTMLAVEASVSATVPIAFPNVLGEDGFPASERQRLELEIHLLEAEIERLTREFADCDFETDNSWSAAVKFAGDWIKKEEYFLDNAPMLFNRYIEMREPLKLGLIQSRHTYLKSIVEMVDGVWVPNAEAAPQPEGPPSA